MVPRPKTRFLRAALVLALVAGTGCGSKGQQKGERPEEFTDPLDLPKINVKVPDVRFTDVTDEAGARFAHTNGSFGQKLLPETMGSGVAFFDFDNDGRPDLLFVNSCHWPGKEEKGERPTLKLFRNKGGTFEDVTKKAGLDVTLYGMGVACGDYDNDGWTDVFVTGVGGNRLFRNEKGRSFADVTAKAGVGGPGGWPERPGNFLEHKEPIGFPSSATFVDYDGDGRLDLFVCNYVTWSPHDDLKQGFTLTGVGRAFGPPRAFKGALCRLYRNAGDRFEDVSEASGVQVWEKEGVGERATLVKAGKSLGVIVCDPDQDGWPDLVVANDTARNFFLHNVPAGDRPGGRAYVEAGLVSGIAFAGPGAQARGAMGIDYGEYRPGRFALLIANFANESNTFLRLVSPRDLRFIDVASPEGIAGKSGGPLKFGAFFFDYDLDGRLDFLTCNGHLEPEISQVQKTQKYAQPVQLYWNTGLSVEHRAYELVGADKAGTDLFGPLVGRGSAYADIDGDGDLDVVLTANGGPARLLRNDGGTGHHWLRLVLKGDGKRSNRSAIGARVEVKVGDRVLRRGVAGARGYLSQSELPITVGLGEANKVDEVTVFWPGKDGGKQVLKDLKADAVYVVEQK